MKILKALTWKDIEEPEEGESVRVANDASRWPVVPTNHPDLIETCMSCTYADCNFGVLGCGRYQEVYKRISRGMREQREQYIPGSDRARSWCAVCHHEKREEIEGRLRAGLGEGNVSAEYGVSWAAALRHREFHMTMPDCVICESPHRQTIEALILKGRAIGTIAKHVPDIAPSHIKKHMLKCMNIKEKTR